MHGRILGITTEQSIKIYEYTRQERLRLPYDEYVESMPHFADYVSKDTNLSEDYEWLMDTIKERVSSEYFSYNNKTKTIVFKDGFKQEWFKASYERFVSMATNCKLDDYVDDFVAAKMVREITGDYGAFWIADEYGEYEPLNDFMRQIEPNKVYQLFDSIDFHC